jgi:hypothetical protein
VLVPSLPPLPDITVLEDTTNFPTVSVASTCVNPVTPAVTCFGHVMSGSNLFALPTLQPAQLNQPWANRRLIQTPGPVVLPPSFGTLCVVPATQAANVSTGTTGNFSVDVTATDGDRCRPLIIPSITFPCTEIVPGTKTVHVVPGGAATGSWSQVAAPGSSLNTCTTILTDILTIPCGAATIGSISNSMSGATGGLALSVAQVGCTSVISGTLTVSVTGGGGGGGSGGISSGFRIGTVLTHYPDSTVACATSYPPRSIVPVFDQFGLIGSAGTEVDPSLNTLTNRSGSVLSVGDVVTLSHVAGTSTPAQWAVLT